MRQALDGRYRVEREVARGGAALVYLAQDAADRTVALKVLRPQLAVSVTAERFLREIELLTDLEHPHIAQMLDYGETHWFLYYVMPFVTGPTVREHLRDVRRATIEHTLRIAHDLLEALGYAHERGIVHRDVKPDNIVMGEDGAVLLDFGIARAIAHSGRDRLTRSGFAVGTSSYMSPEQVEGLDDIDQRSDLYSLGCVLFECLTGQPPFKAEAEETVLQMHLSRTAPQLRSFRRDLPAALNTVLSKALTASRDRRYQSASEFDEALRQVG